MAVLGARFITVGPRGSSHMLEPATGDLLDTWNRGRAAVGTVLPRKRINLLLHVEMKNPDDVATSSGIRIEFTRGPTTYSLVSNFSLTLQKSC